MLSRVVKSSLCTTETFQEAVDKDDDWAADVEESKIDDWAGKTTSKADDWAAEKSSNPSEWASDTTPASWGVGSISNLDKEENDESRDSYRGSSSNLDKEENDESRDSYMSDSSETCYILFVNHFISKLQCFIRLFLDY